MATPFDRWSPVFEYRVKIMRSDGIYIEHPFCSGRDPLIIAELKCTVTMLSLLNAQFGLAEGDNIYATVEALNSIGYSLPSPQSGNALVQIVPHKPPLAPSRGNNTNEAAIEIFFSIVTANGGA